MIYVSQAIKKTKRLPSRLHEISRCYGFLGVFRWVGYQFAWRLREWRLGLKTGQFDLGVVQGWIGDKAAYEPVDYLCFDIIMRHVEIAPQKSVFLDYGCGKGRAVILAALQPFRKVIGIETTPALSDIAKQHVQRVHEKLVAKDIIVVTTDARFYTVPDDVTHIFLYNSFSGEVLVDVLKQIKSSLLRKKRKLTIMYVLPAKNDNKLDKEKWLNKVQSLPTGFSNHLNIYIYEGQ
jgi:SAM-dependent methyltransferase